MVCSECGSENKAGAKFCCECGAPFALRCPGCGSAHRAGQKFCDECGTPLAEGASPAASPRGPAGSVSERRLVSVLFADLVGFTTLSEHRDPEEVRELLSQYFDRCRVVIERYGGMVEKFIGDAVMAVWGTPVAREDDAERAVRAALALTAAVTALGRRGGDARAARASRGADRQRRRRGRRRGRGNGAGRHRQHGGAPAVDRRARDRCSSTTSRAAPRRRRSRTRTRACMRSRAVSGRCGRGRRCASSPARAGRGGAPGWRRRSSAATASSRPSSRRGSRAPASAWPGCVTVIGEAGAGKSRLLWEFFKYLDGIEEERFWHQGRCLSYGEGVAYWALAEMVRSRAGIKEEEPARAWRGRSCTPRCSSTSPTSASGGWSSRGWRTCSGSRSDPTPIALTCSAAGDCSSSGWPRATR